MAMKGGAITLTDGAEVIALEEEPGGIRILAGDGRSWRSHPSSSSGRSGRCDPDTMARQLGH
ncbi:hypothetical protein DPM13_09495 [Paracoccus mutanolyticus]|uniref:Uncharacterized protein n=1 Tax=Paracoccus mutanolyticus TaxID=1499308 RepID=A0ABN5M5P6_9RHOB|nr:hypothetical protein DPM13_09495 [Paracoccus mutanolyticus]